jgi:hypothetical protein
LTAARKLVRGGAGAAQSLQVRTTQRYKEIARPKTK